MKAEEKALTRQLVEQQPLQRDCLLLRMKRDSGVTIVPVRTTIGNFLQDRISLDDVQSKPVRSGINAQNDIVRPNDGFQRPHLVMGSANEMARLGCEFTQFFKLGHRLLQRN